MEQNTGEMLISQIFELFETGEEAINFLSRHEMAENRYLLEDLHTPCAAIASAVEQQIGRAHV